MELSCSINNLYALFAITLVSAKSNPPEITPPTTGTALAMFITPLLPNFVKSLKPTF